MHDARTEADGQADRQTDKTDRQIGTQVDSYLGCVETLCDQRLAISSA
jgi:hypothetical protein